jgi:methyl-accepting chemotaxis protein
MPLLQSRNIRARVLAAMLGIVAVAAAINLVFLGLRFVLVNNYRIAVDGMVTQYELVSLSDSLVESYLALAKDPGSLAARKAYEEKVEEIEGILTTLDQAIASPASRGSFIALRNTVTRVISICESGIEDIDAGRFAELIAKSVEARRIGGYVAENGIALMHSELRHLHAVQGNLRDWEETANLLSLVLLAVAAVGSILISNYFAKVLALPIQKMAGMAREVASGRLDLEPSQELMGQPGEIGELADSFYRMYNSLRDVIRDLEETRDRTEAARAELATSNDELQRLNRVMIGRELRMIELKKEIEKLKGQP